MSEQQAIIRNAVLNWFDTSEPVPLVHTSQGEFLVNTQNKTAYNVVYIKDDFKQYVNYVNSDWVTFLPDSVEAFEQERYVSCGEFERIRDGRATWYMDLKTSVVIPPGARLAFRGVQYSYGLDGMLYIHTPGHHSKLVAVMQPTDLEAWRKSVNRRKKKG